MAVSRFLNVDWSQPISSFVPRPFEAALLAGKQAQDQFDTGKKISGEIDRLSEAIKVAPHDDPAKQQMLSEYRSAIKQTADKYKNNYGSTDFQYEVGNIVEQFKNDKRLSVFNNNLAVWDDYKKYKGDDKNSMSLIHNENQLINPQGGITYNDPLNPKPFTPLRTTKYANEVDEYAKYFDKIKEDAQSINSVDYKGKAMGEGYYFIDANGQHKFIHQDKINRITNANLPGFLRSEAGTYALRERIVKTGLDDLLKQQYGIDAKTINSNNYKQILGNIKDFVEIEIPEYDNKGKATGKTKTKSLSAAEWLDRDIKSNMSGYGQQFIHDAQEVDYHRTADEVRNARVKKEMEESALRPVYETGEVDVKGNTYDFSNTSVSTAERQKMKGAFNPLKAHGEGYLMSNKIDNQGNKKVVLIPDELGEKELSLIDNMMKLRSKKEQDEWNNIKKLTSDYKKSKTMQSAFMQKDPNVAKLADYLDNIYTQANVLANKAVNDLKSNMSIQGLSGKDVKELNTVFGGKLEKDDMQVNDLTTGIGTNSYIYDPSTGEYTTMQKFIDEQSGIFGIKKDSFGKMPVRVSGKLDAKNHLTSITGNANFSDGLQVVINGKPYYVTGPDRYIDQQGNISREKQEQKAFNQTVNRIYQLQLTPELTGEDNILGTKVRTAYNKATGTFVVEPQENISFKSGNKTYNINVKNTGFQGKTPEEAIAEYNLFVQQQIQSSASKK